MEITQEIISLLGCEEKRLRLASALCKNQSQMSKILNLSDRTVFRLENEFMNSEDSTKDRYKFTTKKNKR